MKEKQQKGWNQVSREPLTRQAPLPERVFSEKYICSGIELPAFGFGTREQELSSKFGFLRTRPPVKKGAMLLYGKSWWGIGSIFRLEGSSIPRAMPLVVLSTCGCIFLSMFCSDWLSDRIISYSTFTIFSSIVSFVLVFRVGNSLNRYWEARGAVQTFSAKLCDTASLLVHCAHENTRERNAQGKCNEEEDRRTAELCGRVLHLASLTHAVALQVRSEDSHSMIASVPSMYLSILPCISAHKHSYTRCVCCSF